MAVGLCLNVIRRRSAESSDTRARTRRGDALRTLDSQASASDVTANVGLGDDGGAPGFDVAKTLLTGEALGERQGGGAELGGEEGFEERGEGDPATRDVNRYGFVRDSAAPYSRGALTLLAKDGGFLEERAAEFDGERWAEIS